VSARAAPVIAFGELEPATDPRVERLYEAARQRSTPENMMWAQPQVPPPHWHGLLAPLKRPFPGVPYTEVRAFGFGNDRTPYPNFGEALLDRKVPGCGARAFAKDGTLCPSLNPPGVVLRSDQSQRLVEVLEDAQRRDGRPPQVSMCLPIPTVLFAFFDGSRPVAELWLDPRCPTLTVHPAARRLYPKRYMARHGDDLRQLLCELAVPGHECPAPDASLEAALAAQSKRDGFEISHIRRRRVALGVPGELRTSELSAAQKERLCIGQAMENPIQPGTSYECPTEEAGGRVFSIDTDTCIARFPSCDVTVADVVACQRHSEVDLCLQAPEAAHCRALLPCFFNRSATPGPEHH
jgi:hypothetical protein